MKRQTAPHTFGIYTTTGAIRVYCTAPTHVLSNDLHFRPFTPVTVAVPIENACIRHGTILRILFGEGVVATTTATTTAMPTVLLHQARNALHGTHRRRPCFTIHGVAVVVLFRIVSVAFGVAVLAVVAVVAVLLADQQFLFVEFFHFFLSFLALFLVQVGRERPGSPSCFHRGRSNSLSWCLLLLLLLAIVAVGRILQPTTVTGAARCCQSGIKTVRRRPRSFVEGGGARVSICLAGHVVVRDRVPLANRDTCATFSAQIHGHEQRIVRHDVMVQQFVRDAKGGVENGVGA